MSDRPKDGDPEDPADEERSAVVEESGVAGDVDETQEIPRPAASQLELLLIGKRPEEVLAKIVAGDPLGLGELCAERVQVRAVFLESTRLLRRTFARTAYEACRDPLRGKPTLHGWVLARVDQALAELISEDKNDLWRDIPLDPSHENVAYYHDVAMKLRLEPEQTRRACVEFNALPEATRQVFWSVILDGDEVENCLELGFESVEQVQTRLHEAMVVFLEAGIGDNL